MLWQAPSKIGYLRWNEPVNSLGIVKIFYKSGLGLLLLFTVLLSVMWLLLSTSFFQSFLASKLSSALNRRLGIHLTIGQADVSGLHNLAFDAFCLYGSDNDTLLYTPHLTVGFRRFSLSRKWIEVRQAHFSSPDIRFRTDSAGVVNFQHIIAAFSPKDSTGNRPLRLFLHHVSFDEGRFSFRGNKSRATEYGVNFSDLALRAMNLTVEGFRTLPEGGVTFDIKQLSGVEKSGFDLRKFSAGLTIDRHQLSFRNVSVQTAGSDLSAAEATFSFTSFRQMGGVRFPEWVNLHFDISPSSVQMADLAFFVPAFRGWNQSIDLSAKTEGTLSELKISPLNLTLSGGSHYRGSLEMNGSPFGGNAYLYALANQLVLYPDDVTRILRQATRRPDLVLPSWLLPVEYLEYQGNFTGFLRDFVAYGKIRTNLGSFSTDLLFGPSKLTPSGSSDLSFSFRGTVATDRFALGEFLGMESQVGSVTMKAMVDGVLWNANRVEASMNGMLGRIEIGGYPYEEVAINGLLKGKTFDGNLSVAGDDLMLDFQGKVDLGGVLPAFRFSANVTDANLSALRWFNADSASFASFSVDADFKGTRLDDLDGEIRLNNAFFRKPHQEMKVENLLLFTKKIEGVNRFILRSDLADAEVWGSYRLSNLLPSFYTLLGHYLPSLVPETHRNRLSGGEDRFRFELDLKNLQPFSDYFDTPFKIARDTRIDGEYNPSGNDLTLTLKSQRLEWAKFSLADAFLRCGFSGGRYRIMGGARQLEIPGGDLFEQFRFSGAALSDSAQFTMAWGEPGQAHQASMVWDLLFRRDDLQNKPWIFLKSRPADLVFHYIGWHIDPGTLIFTPGSLEIGGLRISNAGQEIGIGGLFSRRETDTLRISLKNIRLANSRRPPSRKQLAFGGTLNGIARITSKEQKRLVFADLRADSLRMNSQFFGTTRLIADWDPDREQIAMQMHAADRGVETLNVSGDYHPKSKALDVKIGVEQFGVDFFTPFLDRIFSGLEGKVRADLHLTGTLPAPLFNGFVYLDSAAFTLDYLNTRYRVTSRVPVEDNRFLLRNATVFDEEGNRCIANAEVTHKNFKNFHFDFHFRSNNFQSMNLQESDSRPFFGKAYASGEITLKGPPSALQLQMAARTEAGTVISIPLTGATTIGSSDFIRIVSPPSLSKTISPLSASSPEAPDDFVEDRKGLALDLEIETTPAAEVQLIFDEKIGDVIKGRGTASMRMNVTRNGRFTLFGTYTVDQGDYLFTVQNFFQRRFEIERGGTIVWNGDPLDATINMKALYRTRTSLAGLVSPEGGFSELASRRVPVECVLLLSDKLMNPTVDFDIQLQNADQDVREIVSGMLYNQEEKSKQAISLMLLNSFYSEESFFSGETSMDALGSTTSEFLSNQLERFLGQFSPNFSLGVSYRYFSQLQTQSLEMDMSQRLFKEAVSLNASFGNREIVNASRSLVVDADIDIRLGSSGKYRLKGFNRSNDLSLFEPEPYYTQGIGFVYRRDFDRISELMPFRRQPKKEPETAPRTESALRTSEEDDDTSFLRFAP